MEFALKSIIVCDTFGLKTDSAAWLVSIKCFLSLSFKGPLFVLMDVR